MRTRIASSDLYLWNLNILWPLKVRFTLRSMVFVPFTYLCAQIFDEEI